MARQMPPQPADSGDRDYYRNSDNGVECTHALRACLGRDGYVAWLRGQIIKYQWRMGAKEGEKPETASIKSAWYNTELTRVLSDPTA
jgi:hypothetical protein